MKRLTERTYVGGKEYTDLVGVQMEYIANPYKRARIKTAAEKLADYEDAEQDGRMFISPVKIGDIVWDRDERSWRVAAVEFVTPKAVSLRCRSKGEVRIFNAGKEAIGRTVFLSKIEAKNAE